MTVTTTLDRQYFDGDGSNKVFPFNFRFFTNDQIYVSLIEPDGTITPLNLTTNYTLSGALLAGGGTVTMLVAPPLTVPATRVFIQRILPQVQPTSIRNQGKFYPEIHEDAFDRLTMLIQQALAGLANALQLTFGKTGWNFRGYKGINVGEPTQPSDASTKAYVDSSSQSNNSYTDAQLLRTVRGGSGENLTQLPPALSRANKVMGFDASGNPVGVLPASGSGMELAIDLANKIDLSKGAGQIGFDGRWLNEYLIQQGYWRTVEYFGPTDTPANTKATMQIAINWCAANGYLLRSRARSYTVDLSASGITIPNNFRCDFDGSWILRQTGNTTPHDMWANADMSAGNTGIDIRGVRFNGRAQADSLTNENIAHRFCGLRLVKCEVVLRDVRADNTVNGEIQTEGTRGGILLQQSVYADCENLRGEGTIGTAVFVDGGNGRLYGLRTKNNTGSGLSGNQGGWDMFDLRSEISGYSGISLNGSGFRARCIYGSGAAFGFAGVNIGHVGSGSEAVNSRVFDVLAENNLQWGINVSGAQGVFGRGWRGVNNVEYNLRLTAAPDSDVEMESEGSTGGVIYRDSVGIHRLKLVGRGSRFVATTSGVEVIFSSDSLIRDVTNATLSGIQADPGCKIVYPGSLLNNSGWGATANSGIVSLIGATVSGNGTPWRSLSGGLVNFRSVSLDESVPTSGTITIPALSASGTVLNKNSITQSRVSIMPLNSEARGIGIPAISALTLGVGFTVTLSGSGHSADAIYTYVLL